MDNERAPLKAKKIVVEGSKKANQEKMERGGRKRHVGERVEKN